MTQYKYEDEWFEETNVSRKIKDWLEKNGYNILHFNENKKSKGYDIVAENQDGKIIVEVKGFPSDRYVSGSKCGEKKKTNPNTQARHWFAEGLLALIIAKSKDEKVKIALGLPKKKTYVTLMNNISLFIKKFGLICLLVDENGNVEQHSGYQDISE